MTHLDPASVSVVIPVRDGAAFLGEAIESVLAQTVAPGECIVVDDGSVDASAEVASGFAGVRVVRQTAKGVPAARNRGVAEATGTVMAFLDADDRWRSDWLDRMARAMGEDDAVVCASETFGARAPMGSTLRLRPVPPRVEDLLMWRGTVPPLGSNLLVRREALARAGGFDDTLDWGEDWAIVLRLLAAGRLRYVDDPLVFYRWHEANRTQDADIDAAVRRTYASLLAELPTALPRRHVRAGMHRYLAAAHWRMGRRARSIRHSVLSALQDPSTAASYAAASIRGARTQRSGPT